MQETRKAVGAQGGPQNLSNSHGSLPSRSPRGSTSPNLVPKAALHKAENRTDAAVMPGGQKAQLANGRNLGISLQDDADSFFDDDALESHPLSATKSHVATL